MKKLQRRYGRASVPELRPSQIAALKAAYAGRANNVDRPRQHASRTRALQTLLARGLVRRDPLKRFVITPEGEALVVALGLA